MRQTCENTVWDFKMSSIPTVFSRNDNTVERNTEQQCNPATMYITAAHEHVQMMSSIESGNKICMIIHGVRPKAPFLSHFSSRPYGRTF